MQAAKQDRHKTERGTTRNSVQRQRGSKGEEERERERQAEVLPDTAHT